MKTPLRWLLMFLASVSVLGNLPEATAQEEFKIVGSPAYVLAAEEPSKFWIGVIAVPIDNVLKSHLGLEAGLVVQEVVDDSPAAKAGLKKHDILIHFGDKQLTSLKELINAVEFTGEKEVELQILRGGKEQELKLTPADRPENDFALRVEDHDRIRNVLGTWIEKEPHKGAFSLRFLGPALAGEEIDVRKLAGEHDMPKNVTIIIKKEGEGPAAITVKRDSDNWDVTEEKLSELPEDVRIHVKKFLNRLDVTEARPITIRALTLGVPKANVETDIDVEEVRSSDGEDEDGEEGEKRRRRTRVLNQRIELVPQAGVKPQDLLKKLNVGVVGPDLDGLRTEIQALRKDLDALKKQLHQVADDEEEDDDEIEVEEE